MAAFDPAKRTMFPDVYDNIDKIAFDVIVQENYQATMKIIEYDPALLKENPWLLAASQQPIRDVDDSNSDELCYSKLPARYIVDAIVNGKYIRFCYTTDMMYMKSWLEIYVKQFEKVDLTNHPYSVFIKNCKRVIELMSSNITEYNKAQEARNPKPLSIVDLMSVI